MKIKDLLHSQFLEEGGTIPHTRARWEARWSQGTGSTKLVESPERDTEDP